MKKTFTLMFVVTVIFSLSACDNQNVSMVYSSASLLNKIQTAVSLPRNLIVGSTKVYNISPTPDKIQPSVSPPKDLVANTPKDSIVSTPKVDNGNSIPNKIQSLVSSPKDLIVGNWVLVDILMDGKSTFTPKQRQTMESDVYQQRIFVFEKDKTKAFIGGLWFEVKYIWLDDKTIETIQVTKDGKTVTNSNRVEVTADKLIVYLPKKIDNIDKELENVYKKFKGELPKAKTTEQIKEESQAQPQQ